jgi:hypothetical protein
MNSGLQQISVQPSGQLGANDEIRMTKPERNPKSEIRNGPVYSRRCQLAAAVASGFRFRASFGFRHSSFVIRHSSFAFSLLEVMIALGIFFMAVFAILGLVSSTLKNARSLERPQVDAGLAAAMFTNTNHFTEGSFDGDFGDALQGYSWEAETYEFASNGLVQADIILQKRGSSQPADTLSILMWDPNFKSSSLPSGAKLR